MMAPCTDCRRWIQGAVSRKAGGRLRLERLQLEAPREDEVLVRLVASGICHTDITFWQCGGTDAVVLGHEGAGVVEYAGPKTKGIKRGDHVVLSYQSCGRCRSCKRGRPADCAHFWELNFGFARLDGSNALAASGVRGHFFGQSSFATHTIASVRNLVKVSKSLPLELLAPLGCGLQTGAGTVINSLAVKPGSSIAILGTGSVGLAAVMAARLVGADPIIGIDIRPKRLALARELGATHTVEVRRTMNLGRSIAALTGGGMDYVVDTAGDASLANLACKLLNPGGRLALLTAGSGPHNLPDGREVLHVIQGDAVPQQFIPYLIKLHGKGAFPFDRLITFYPFWEINRAIADSRSGKTIKPVLRMAGPGNGPED
jgi:aryl-alcohol dehydrogenase